MATPKKMRHDLGWPGPRYLFLGVPRRLRFWVPELAWMMRLSFAALVLIAVGTTLQLAGHKALSWIFLFGAFVSLLASFIFFRRYRRDRDL
jgi:hypothetical protein